MPKDNPFSDNPFTGSSRADPFAVRGREGHC